MSNQVNYTTVNGLYRRAATIQEMQVTFIKSGMRVVFEESEPEKFYVYAGKDKSKCIRKVFTLLNLDPTKYTQAIIECAKSFSRLRPTNGLTQFTIDGTISNCFEMVKCWEFIGTAVAHPDSPANQAPPIKAVIEMKLQEDISIHINRANSNYNDRNYDNHNYTNNLDDGNFGDNRDNNNCDNNNRDDDNDDNNNDDNDDYNNDDYNNDDNNNNNNEIHQGIKGCIQHMLYK